jgi:hypothetical protein
MIAGSLGACGSEAPEPAAAAMLDMPREVVDSIFPIDEELRRFRALLGPEPAGLSGGSGSLDALVDRFVQAVIDADTAAFADMLLTRDEFGSLYYPTTRFASRPYELAPGMVWLQIGNGTSQGLSRLLGRLAGRPLTMTGQVCPPEPRVEGLNRIWEGCTVQLDHAEGRLDASLFGSILERGGVFKFVSYTNGF